jgi:hypothetical protein
MLKSAAVILNALDYDAAGKKAIGWWEERFVDYHRRWPVPEGKDPGDAFKAGVDMAAWIRAGLPEVWSWKTNGRSNLLNEIKKEVTEEISSLKELVALVRSSPVVICVGPGRLKIKDAPLWARANPCKARRISDLVFLNEEVKSFLMGMENAELNSRNIDRLFEDGK